LFHLVFESHDGRALAVCGKTSLERRGGDSVVP
jgi:hypothetical protein